VALPCCYNTHRTTIQVSNRGGSNLVVGAITANFPIWIFLDNCSNKTLAPGGVCPYEFGCADWVGSRSISIPSNDPDENPFTVAVTCNPG
jgi:hypothetical protein